MKKVGVIGSGQVGEVLANAFLTLGYEVMRGTRETKKLEAWQSKAGAKAKVGTFDQTAKFADIVVLAVKGTAAAQAIELCGTANLTGKIVIDATNPIADAAPVNGVLRFFTGPNESLMETLQKAAPQAKFVKAFSCVGNAFMFQPKFQGGKPTMFICGRDTDAKMMVKEILDGFGWETADMGDVEAARAIEPLCMLWCIPGLRQGSWSHAFKLLQA